MKLLYTYRETHGKDLITFIKLEGEDLISFKWTSFGKLESALCTVERYGREYRVLVYRMLNAGKHVFRFTVEGLDGAHVVEITKAMHDKPNRQKVALWALEAIQKLQYAHDLAPLVATGKLTHVKVVETPVTEDTYCMDCGESCEPKSKRCGYCGGRDIDVMEIEAEVLTLPVEQVRLDDTVLGENGVEFPWTSELFASAYSEFNVKKAQEAVVAEEEAEAVVEAGETVEAPVEAVEGAVVAVVTEVNGKQALEHMEAGGVVQVADLPRFYRMGEGGAFYYATALEGAEWKRSDMSELQVKTYPRWVLVPLEREEPSREELGCEAVENLKAHFEGAQEAVEAQEAQEQGSAPANEPQEHQLELKALKMQWSDMVKQYNHNDELLNQLSSDSQEFQEVLERQKVVDMILELLEDKIGELGGKLYEGF